MHLHEQWIAIAIIMVHDLNTKQLNAHAIRTFVINHKVASHLELYIEVFLAVTLPHTMANCVRVCVSECVLYSHRPSKYPGMKIFR